MSTVSIQVNTRCLKAARLFISEDETRQPLCGVRVYPCAEHVTYVGTDGRRLLALRHERTKNDRETCAPFTVRPELIDGFRGARVSSGPAEMVVGAPRPGWELRMVGIYGDFGDRGATLIALTELGGRYPDDWQKVCPKSRHLKRAGGTLNADFVAAAAKAHGLLCYQGEADEDGGRVRGPVSPPYFSTWVDPENEDGVRIVKLPRVEFDHVMAIMPVRDSNPEGPAVPSWAKEGWE